MVISLVYLAVQIRDQNKQSRLTAMHEMSRELRHATTMFANQPYENITEAESVRWVILVTNLYRAWENAFLENKDGHLDRGVWWLFHETT